MQTRAKTSICKPKVYLTTKECSSLTEALQHLEWKASMTNEYLSLLRNNTWFLVYLPINKKSIGSN